MAKQLETKVIKIDEETIETFNIAADIVRAHIFGVLEEGVKKGFVKFSDNDFEEFKKSTRRATQHYEGKQIAELYIAYFSQVLDVVDSKIEETTGYDAILKNYHIVENGSDNKFLIGQIYSDSKKRFKDGDTIKTSNIVYIDKDQAKTKNTLYKLENKGE